jgi:hypothetical protein
VYFSIYSVGRVKYDKLRDRVIRSTKSVQGGWKPNMWGSYPLHELGSVRQLPEIDWFNEPKPRRAELQDRKRKKDEFASRLDVEKMDHDAQRNFR